MAIGTDANLYKDLCKVLLTREEIAQAIDAVGKRITADYAGKAPLFVCILKGAVVFYSDLIRAIDLPLTMDFMAVSSYGSGTVSSGAVNMIKDLERNVSGMDLVIVEDIVDTGRTLHYLKQLMLDRGAASVRICTLLDKPARRAEIAKDLQVDYVCFNVPDEFVVGYGLDYNEQYRNLPDIGVLSPEKYS